MNLVLPTSSYLEMENKKLSLKEKITIDAIREIFQRKGYKFFTNGKYNLNLLGVRKDTSVSNKFDDYLVAIYKSEDDEWKCLVWEATTDPGKHWLENPLNPAGTAILIPNQYRSTWKVGYHRGKYRSQTMQNLKVILHPSSFLRLTHAYVCAPPGSTPRYVN